jgi:adenosylcobinamide kinase/adenosylcobinamide-phosphate guanylyltransferase
MEEPMALARALAQFSRPDMLVVVDCLTLWLTNLVMPAAADNGQHDFASDSSMDLAGAPIAQFLEALSQAAGPVVLVGNEIGMGVIPMGAQVRAFVDTLGRLNQDVARVCSRVTLMAAGLPLTLHEACVPIRRVGRFYL